MLALATTLLAMRTLGDENAFNGAPVFVVALASATTKVTMIVALARIARFGRSCGAAAMLATAIGALSIGFFVDAVTLSVPLVASEQFTDRVMLDYWPMAALVSGGAALLFVTGALRRIASKVGTPRFVVRGRQVQMAAVGGVVAMVGVSVAWLPATFVTVIGLGAVGALAAVSPE